MTITTKPSGVKISKRELFPKAVREILSEYDMGELPVSMHASDATAEELGTTDDGVFGLDLLRFPARGCVPMHTHPGAHILIVIAGNGFLHTPDDKIELFPGLSYVVPEGVPHEIRADRPLSLLSCGNKRRPPESPERLSVC